MSKRVAAAAMTLCLTLACRPSANVASESARPASTEPAATSRPEAVLPDGAAIALELATDDETREQGLMYRESLDPDKGMLFIFPASGEYPFWMKNTMIPLDMIWIDDGRRVVHVEASVPPCTADPCPSYPPGVMAKYVLELKAGEAAAHHLQAGNVIEMRNLGNVRVR